ncbi:hypothetical protein EV175_006042 [Coemansia sp. RSA 1933]|nr:hypothetical protein EV175_006042 [Coemansia sp. RSA 1933]
MPSPQTRSSLEGSRESLLLQEPPPEYSLLPRSDETYIDAGAGAPIARIQPPHIVVNPSDSRSQYSQNYFTSGGVAPPVPPRRADTSSGPIPINPRLPPRLNVGYEQIETVPHLTPRTHNSQPRLQEDWAYPPHSQWERRTQPERLIPHAFAPTIVPGPSPQRNRSYSSNHGRYPPPPSQGVGYPGNAYHHPAVTYNVVCPTCRNTGWASSRMPCSCPVGSAASNSGSRTYGGGSSSLLGLLDDILNPNSRFYSPHPYNEHRGAYR